MKTTTGRILVTAFPFGTIDRDPIDVLEAEGADFTLNPKGRRLQEEELAALIEPYEVLIAGTEPITARVLERAPNLRFISRVGIGLDSVDLAASRSRGVLVSYTPSAPSPAVAELTIGQMLTLLRGTATADREVRSGVWHRKIGRRLALMTVGVVGVGRIGRLVIQRLQGWSSRILAHDLRVDSEFSRQTGCIWTDLNTICREADIITLHVPLTPRTKGMIGEAELSLMKPEAILINTARGEIVDEHALISALRRRPDLSAAIDVFSEEPYKGELITLKNCLLSAHMGSATRDCRKEMELAAAEEALRFLRGEPLTSPVPEEEFIMQAEV